MSHINFIDKTLKKKKSHKLCNVRKKKNEIGQRYMTIDICNNQPPWIRSKRVGIFNISSMTPFYVTVKSYTSYRFYFLQMFSICVGIVHNSRDYIPITRTGYAFFEVVSLSIVSLEFATINIKKPAIINFFHDCDLTSFILSIRHTKSVCFTY